VRISRIATIGLLSSGFTLGACQGDTFDQPPIHPQQNMDFQKRMEAQESNPFFEDGRAMRPEIEGTVARDNLRTDDHLFRGKVDGDWAKTLPETNTLGEPMTLDAEFLQRGQERFEIFCTPCHGFTGEGNGLAVQRGMIKPTSLYVERLQGMGVGYFYDVITNGRNNMMPYAAQVPVNDRWAIAAYVRVLQRSRAATLDQVPEAEAAARGWEAK
jgi:mono/diheme cytochrome c family protein